MPIDVDKLQMPPSEDCSELTFGDRLKAVREARGISQNKLAKVSGIPQSSISLFETGSTRPTVTTLEWICKALKVSATELLGF